jgi:hypothetical protein
MNDPRIFVVERSNARFLDVVENACAAIREWASIADFQIKLSDISRSLDQNAAMWPALRDFAQQVPWEINGEPQLMEPEDWKDVLTAAFEFEMRVAPALQGGWVMLGARTSRYGKKRMGEFLTFVRAEGDNRGVRWSAPAKANFDEYIDRVERAAA